MIEIALNFFTGVLSGDDYLDSFSGVARHYVKVLDLSPPHPSSSTSTTPPLSTPAFSSPNACLSHYLRFPTAAPLSSPACYLLLLPVCLSSSFSSPPLLPALRHARNATTIFQGWFLPDLLTSIPVSFVEMAYVLTACGLEEEEVRPCSSCPVEGQGFAFCALILGRR